MITLADSLSKLSRLPAPLPAGWFAFDFVFEARGDNERRGEGENFKK